MEGMEDILLKEIQNDSIHFHLLKLNQMNYYAIIRAMGLIII